MINKTIINFTRHARHAWKCSVCGKCINAGDVYKDREIKTYCDDDTMVISHKRFCTVCAGLVKEPKQFVFKEPEPVIFEDIKYKLIGLGYDKNVLRLIIEDWATGTKHWADKVYDYNWDLLNTNNVRFVNA